MSEIEQAIATLAHYGFEVDPHKNGKYTIWEDSLWAIVTADELVEWAKDMVIFFSDSE